MEEYRLDLEIKTAINGIESIALLHLSKEAIEKWLAIRYETWEIMKWQVAFDPSIYIKGGLMDTFESIWNHINKIMGHFEIEAKCETAMQEYESIFAENPNTKSICFQVWLLKYEKLGREDLILPPIKGKNIRMINGVMYVLSGKNFKKSIEFYKLFNQLFWVEQILDFRIDAIKMQRRVERSKLKGKH